MGLLDFMGFIFMCMGYCSVYHCFYQPNPVYAATSIQWGEGSGGGWFRLHRGVDALSMESSSCAWAVPAAADVNRAIEQYESSLAV